MLLEELHVDGMPPLWYTIVEKGLNNGKKFYFGAGGNRIYAVEMTTGASPNEMNIALYLEHTRKKDGGKLRRQLYRVPPKSLDSWTLVKFEDGHCLRPVSD